MKLTMNPVFTDEMVDGQIIITEKYVYQTIPKDNYLYRLVAKEQYRIEAMGISREKAIRMIVCVITFCKIIREFGLDHNGSNYPGLTRAIQGLPATDAEKFLYRLVIDSKRNHSETN